MGGFAPCIFDPSAVLEGERGEFSVIENAKRRKPGDSGEELLGIVIQVQFIKQSLRGGLFPVPGFRH